MPPLRIGILGLRFGRSHLEIAVRTPGVDVVAIADRDPQRLDACGEAFGVVHRYRDFEELLARRDLDLVVLAIPHHLHAAMAIAAFARGLHVIVEKPIAHSVVEAEAMVAAARRAGRILAISTQKRFEDAVQAARAAMAAGTIGRIRQAESRWLLPRPFEGLWQRGDWFLDVRLAGGGPFHDLGWHALDTALFVLGFPPIERVSCRLSRGVGVREAAKRGVRFELEDSACADLRLRGDIDLRVEAGIFSDTITEEIQQLRLVGDRGTLHITAGTARVRSTSGVETVVTAPSGTARSTIDHVARVLRGEEPLLLDADQAVLEQRIFEAAYASDRLGAPVEVLPTVRVRLSHDG